MFLKITLKEGSKFQRYFFHFEIFEKNGTISKKSKKKKKEKKSFFSRNVSKNFFVKF
jgi:hypothetical protein